MRGDVQRNVVEDVIFLALALGAGAGISKGDFTKLEDGAGVERDFVRLGEDDGWCHEALFDDDLGSVAVVRGFVPLPVFEALHAKSVEGLYIIP